MYLSIFLIYAPFTVWTLGRTIAAKTKAMQTEYITGFIYMKMILIIKNKKI